MDKSLWVSAAFGGALVIAGLLMMRSHWRLWQTQQDDPELDEADLKYFRRRFRRRMQASGLLTIIGVILPLGDILSVYMESPAVFFAYSLILLLLVMWVFLLALGDMASTKVHTTVSLNRIRAEQRKLEQEAAALRAQISNEHSSSNGSAPKNDPEQ